MKGIARRAIGWGAVIATAVVAAATLGSAPAGAATGVDGFPILHAASGQMAHRCEVLGSAVNPNNGDEILGVVCADIQTYQYEGDVYANASVEALCEVNYGDSRVVTTQCANIVAKADMSNGAGGRYYSTKACGHQNGACPSGRFIHDSPVEKVNTEGGACGTSPTSISQVWGIALAGTQIELPGSALTVGVTSNWSTGHFYVCY